MKVIDGEYVISVRTAQTVGNVKVDLVYLDDGTVLGISDDLVCLYRNWYEALGMGNELVSMIERPLYD